MKFLEMSQLTTLLISFIILAFFFTPRFINFDRRRLTDIYLQLEWKVTLKLALHMFRFSDKKNTQTG